jgi:hypothetical protein
MRCTGRPVNAGAGTIAAPRRLWRGGVETHLAPVAPDRRGDLRDSLVEGPLLPAVWRIAWPTMLHNVIGGLQGIVDHAMVGHYVGYTGNAAIGVSWQIFLVVVVFISSLFTGMSVLVARFAGAATRSG